MWLNCYNALYKFNKFEYFCRLEGIKKEYLIHSIQIYSNNRQIQLLSLNLNYQNKKQNGNN